MHDQQDQTETLGRFRTAAERPEPAADLAKPDTRLVLLQHQRRAPLAQELRDLVMPADARVTTQRAGVWTGGRRVT